MMELVNPAHPGLPRLFDRPEADFVLSAMAAGNSPALVWVDDPAEPSGALIWDQMHCLYLAGDSASPRFVGAVRDLLAGHIIPDAARRHLSVFKVYPADPAWQAQAPALFHPLIPQGSTRVLYRLNPPLPAHPAAALPDGLQVRAIDRALLGQEAVPGVQAVINEIELCWTSRERFLEHGFGYAVVSERDGLLCWCTAEYVSAGRCGIGIETFAPYQRQGLATAAARAFVEHAARLGWQAHWDSWMTNAPSIRVAVKIGLQNVVEYPVSWVALSGANPSA